MKKLLTSFLVLMTSTLSHAQEDYWKGVPDDHLKPKEIDILSYGIHNEKSFYGFSVGDTEHFDQNEKLNGNYRYGYGSGVVQIGNGLGVELTSSSGLTFVGIKGSGMSVSPLVGAEFGGKITYNTNSDVHSFYEWHPSVSLGVQTGNDWLQCTAAAKGGVAVGNLGNTSILPSGARMLGGSLSLVTKPISIGYERLGYGGGYVESMNLKGSLDKAAITIITSRITAYGLDDKSITVLWSVRYP